MPLKAYLQLVRLPNVFTAAADSLAGWLLVTGSFDQPNRWLPLVGASMAIYAAGIALNDLFDLDIDRVERPNRPLPSARVSPRFAAGLGVGLLVMGLALASLGGAMAATWGSAAVSAVLIACVVGYDSGLKRTPIGPLIMGSCRGLNVLLGMSQAPNLGGPTGWMIVGAMTLFVAGVTCVSRTETRAGESAGLVLGGLLENIALAGLIVVAVRPSGWESESSTPVAGLLILIVLGLVLNRANLQAWRTPVPGTLQRAVKTGILSLIWLNVGIVAAARGLPMSLAIAFLWLPAYLLGKRLYST
jgi:4-hydroxybenzoate polyprenyltransferase